MELQVLVSKKGTRVVTASNLHRALELPDHHFARNARKWLHDIYEFKDGIRRPEKMRDFADRKGAGTALQRDFYLTLELAKLITLSSRSKQKQKYAKWLYALEDQSGEDYRLKPEQVTAMLQLTQAMALVSCQKACERRHLEVYAERNGGSASNWWKHRASVLGYSPEQVQAQADKLGKTHPKRPLRKLLMKLDKYETIRMGIIDLFMAMGKSEHYARQLGDLAKNMAHLLNVDVFDDREDSSIFAPRVDPNLIRQLMEPQPQGALNHLW